MKKTLYILLSAMTVIAAASCAKKEIEEQQPATPDPVEEELELVDMTFSAGADLVRVYIAEEGTKLYWEEDDDIAIFDNLNPDTPRKFEILNINDNTADFNGQVAKGSTEFYAVYPYSAAVSLSDGNLEATLPDEQKLGENNASQGAFLAVGKVKNGNIEFVNVFGRIKIDVTYSDVSEIIVSGDNMSGTATFNSETGELVSVSDAKGSAKLLPKEGDAVFTPGTYYLSLLPGTTEAGKFTVTMKRPVINYDGELAYSATQVATGAVTVKRGGGINFADIDTKLTWTIHLDNKAELLAWNNAYQQWKANDNVYLDNDIELDNEPVEWTSHPFHGTFDGQGYAITKIHVEKAGDANFFGTVSGTVKNLTFGAPGDGSCFTVSGSGNSAVAPISSLAGTGHLDGIVNYAEVKSDAGFSGARLYMGGIVSQSDGALDIRNCVNYGNMTASGTAATGGLVVMGGILGYRTATAAAAGTIESCTNVGVLKDLYNRGSSGTRYSRVGGIVGWNALALTIKDCVNGEADTEKGEIYKCGTGSCTHYDLAGIIAWNSPMSNYSNCPLVIDNCINYAPVHNSPDDGAGSYVYLSGIIAANDPYVDGDSYFTSQTISNCVNYGAITNHVTGASQVRMGGFMGDGANTTQMTDCTNYGKCSHIGGCPTGEKTDMNIRLSGLVGSSTKGAKGVQFTRCNNYGDLYVENTTGNKYTAFVGGLLGYTSRENTSFVDCKGYCTISINENPGTINLTGRQIAGRIVAATVQKCGVAGTIGGTELTNLNEDEDSYYTKWIYYRYNGAAVTEVDNYFLGNEPSDTEPFDDLEDGGALTPVTD